MVDLKHLVKKLSQFKILLASDIKQETINDIDENSLIQKIIELRNVAIENSSTENNNAKKLELLKNDDIERIIYSIKNEKLPRPIQSSIAGEFRSEVAGIEEKFSVDEKEIPKVTSIDDFTKYFKNRLEKIKRILDKKPSISFLNNIEEMQKNKYLSGREIAIVGIVSKKIITKNGNIMVELEDETDIAKVIFMNKQGMNTNLFKDAEKLVNDEVIGVKGKISNPFIIANEIMWPEPVIKLKKNFEDDFSVAFISDIHAGSKLFMEKNFQHMLKWINGKTDGNTEIAGKIKYIVIAGDIADGIGIYPNQDKDLQIQDIYQQYSLFFNMLESIPDYIHVFVMPGNHDATQRAEPQPPFDSTIIKDFKKTNVHIIQNPSYITMNGLEVLSYHGTSLDSVIAAIPGLTYSRPEIAMQELLKRRHLSPIYGGNIIVPGIKDNLVIDKTPDILHMGHIHKNGLVNYHGVKILNSGTWQAKTEFQIKQGHIPTPCKMPVFNSKTDRFTIIDFAIS